MQTCPLCIHNTNNYKIIRKCSLSEFFYETNNIITLILSRDLNFMKPKVINSDTIIQTEWLKKSIDDEQHSK